MLFFLFETNDELLAREYPGVGFGLIQNQLAPSRGLGKARDSFLEQSPDVIAATGMQTSTSGVSLRERNDERVCV